MPDVERLDERDYDAWYDVYAAAHHRDYDCPWLSIEKRVNLVDDEYGTKIALLRRDGERIVAGGVAVLPLRDNTTLAYVDAWVHPDDRRRGHGSAVLAALCDVARDAGRTRLFAEAVWGVDDETSAGREFVLARGFTADLVDAIRQLDSPSDPPEAPAAEGYTLHTWRGECPDQWVEEYADLRQRMNSEAPSGDVGLEEEYWDADRVRLDEAATARSRREIQVVVARHDAGRLVGHTQLLFPEDGVEVYQWDTLVLPEHRGHGLGLALKVAAMRASVDLLEGRRRVTTYNAGSNAPMIAVNERLGFRQVAWCGEHVRDV